MQRIIYAADLTQDQPLDVYNENLTLAIEHTVEVMQTNRNFVPISKYERKALTNNGSVPLDRVLFLSATMRAANNDAYNKEASFSDALRGPYYTGDKSIYDFDTVSADFNIGMATDYILLFLVGWIMIKDLAEIIFTCVSRIFNMILLYLISPPLIAATPLDGGNKLRQWITAMVVQSFGVFGTIISMRIMMLLIQVMLSDKLILFSNVFLNILGKVILIMGALEVEKKAQGLITGILADNAGMQAISAGDMKETAGKFLGGAASAGIGVLKAGYETAKGTAKMGLGASKLTGKGMMAAGKSMADAGGRAAKKIGNMFSRDGGASGGSASDNSGVRNLGNLGGSNGRNMDSGIGEGIEMQDLSSKVADTGSKDNGVSGGSGNTGGGSATGPVKNAAAQSTKIAAQSTKATDTVPKAAGSPTAGAEPKKVPEHRADKGTGKAGNNGRKAKQKYDPLSNPGPNGEAFRFSGTGRKAGGKEAAGKTETPAQPSPAPQNDRKTESGTEHNDYQRPAGTRPARGSTSTGSIPGKKVTDGSDPLSQMSRRPSKVPPTIHRDQK